MLNLDMTKNQSHDLSKLIQTELEDHMEIARSSELILPAVRQTITNPDDDENNASPKM